MHVDRVWFLHCSFLYHSNLVFQAQAYPVDALTTFENGAPTSVLSTSPYHEILRRSNVMSTIHGLPSGMYGVFKSAINFQPPLPIASFTKFFQDAAQLYRNDAVPGRVFQQFKWGSLMLEVTAVTQLHVNGKLQYVQTIVAKEIVEAVALWLLDSAQKGWTEFFEAWIVDNGIADTVYYVHLANTWDSWTVKPLEFLEELIMFGSR